MWDPGTVGAFAGESLLCPWSQAFLSSFLISPCVLEPWREPDHPCPTSCLSGELTSHQAGRGSLVFKQAQRTTRQDRVPHACLHAILFPAYEVNVTTASILFRGDCLAFQMGQKPPLWKRR
jgi:hypothetical protein